MTLQGDLATILEWIDRTGKPGYKPPGRYRIIPIVSLGQNSGLSRASTSYCCDSKKVVDGRDMPGHVGEGYFTAGAASFAAAGGMAGFFASSAAFFCAACKSSTAFSKPTIVPFSPSICRLAASIFC